MSVRQSQEHKAIEDLAKGHSPGDRRSVLAQGCQPLNHQGTAESSTHHAVDHDTRCLPCRPAIVLDLASRQACCQPVDAGLRHVGVLDIQISQVAKFIAELPTDYSSGSNAKGFPPRICSLLIEGQTWRSM